MLALERSRSITQNQYLAIQIFYSFGYWCMWNLFTEILLLLSQLLLHYLEGPLNFCHLSVNRPLSQNPESPHITATLNVHLSVTEEISCHLVTALTKTHRKTQLFGLVLFMKTLVTVIYVGMIPSTANVSRVMVIMRKRIHCSNKRESRRGKPQWD